MLLFGLMFFGGVWRWSLRWRKRKEEAGGVDVEGRDRSRVERTVEGTDEYRGFRSRGAVRSRGRCRLNRWSWRSTWKVEIETEIEFESDMNVEHQRSSCSLIEREMQIYRWRWAVEIEMEPEIVQCRRTYQYENDNENDDPITTVKITFFIIRISYEY